MPLTGEAKVIYQRYYMRKRRQSGLDWNYKGIKCANCGYNEIVDRHHIDGNYNNNDFSNLIDLCPNCHALVHRGRKTLKWLPKPPLIDTVDKTSNPVRPIDADGNVIYDD